MSVQVVEGIIGAIQKRIDEYESMATDLAHDYIQSDKPFPTDLKKRYDSISEISEGLIEAIGIIKTGDYMKEDIDLSGDEEID